MCSLACELIQAEYLMAWAWNELKILAQARSFAQQTEFKQAQIEPSHELLVSSSTHLQP